MYKISEGQTDDTEPNNTYFVCPFIFGINEDERKISDAPEYSNVNEITSRVFYVGIKVTKDVQEKFFASSKFFFYAIKQ